MYYDKRNRGNLNDLAENTRKAAYKWYQYCLDNNINILIYETIRTKATQEEYVKKGASKTMRSYHLVGQALDFVPIIDSKGTAGWSIKDYTRKDILDAIKYAKTLGFTWGGDWNNNGDWRDEKFLDSPHLQFEYKGYGTDGRQPINLIQPKPEVKPTTPLKEGKLLELTQPQKNSLANTYKLARDKGIFSSKENEEAVLNGTMTESRAIYLNGLILGALMNDGKRV